MFPYTQQKDEVAGELTRREEKKYEKTVSHARNYIYTKTKTKEERIGGRKEIEEI